MTQHLQRENVSEEQRLAQKENETTTTTISNLRGGHGTSTSRTRRHTGFVVPTVQTHGIATNPPTNWLEPRRRWTPMSPSRASIFDSNKRRARSLSPTRRSPRIRHTQGRLHVQYELEQESYNATRWYVALHRSPQHHQLSYQLKGQNPHQHHLGGVEGASRNVTAAMDRSSRRSHQLQPVTPTRPPATPTTLRAVKQCGCSRPLAAFEWIQIKYSDESLREKQEAKMNQLISCARNDPQTSTRAILAKKALKYRRVLSNNEDPSKGDTTFDFSRWNRIKWCKLQRVE